MRETDIAHRRYEYQGVESSYVRAHEPFVAGATAIAAAGLALATGIMLSLRK